MIATDRYLVRHGESDIPAGSIQHEYPLSELGREQARLVGERLRSLHVDPSNTAGLIAAPERSC